MLHGPCPTFVVGNHQHHLKRYEWRNVFFLGNLIALVAFILALFRALMFDIHIFQVKPALPVLRQLIYLNDEEVLTDACWALSYLSDGPNDKIQAEIQAGVCPRLVELLRLAQFCYIIAILAGLVVLFFRFLLVY